IAYIYGFPFVLLGYILWWGFRLARATNRWLMDRAPSRLTIRSIVVTQTAPQTVPAPASSDIGIPVTTRTGATEILRFMLRPFRRFMVLWCILMLVTTHATIEWLCVVVVLAHLARQIFIMVRFLVFSPWLGENMGKIGSTLLTPLNNALAALGNVTHDAAPTNQLRNLLNELNIWRTVVDFLKDPYLMSRWTWIMGTVFFAALYLYIAFLFSFAYYGIAQLSGVSYSWPDSFVNSIFFPFFFRDLPRVLGVKLLSGIHCVLLLGVGIGTILNFLRRKLDDIRRAAMDVSNRFTEESIHEKYIILQELFSTSAASAYRVEEGKNTIATSPTPKV
ncbi:MAG TPA: hypothetical protein VI685_28005, partial [Candidatus Angelobacter sp.]